VQPRLEAVCDPSAEALAWFERIPTVRTITGDRRRLLEDPALDVLYLAVPHHLHEELYLDAIAAGKDFLGEKPFGIDLAAGAADRERARRAPGRVRALLERDALLPGRPARLRGDPLRGAR
jgi:predicted dehydrogenase